MKKLWAKTLLYESLNLYKKQNKLTDKINCLALHSGRGSESGLQCAERIITLLKEKDVLVYLLHALSVAVGSLPEEHQSFLREFFIKRRNKESYLALTQISESEFALLKKQSVQRFCKSITLFHLDDGLLDALQRYDFVQKSLRRFG